MSQTTCDDVLERLEDLDELASGRQPELERHLASCDGCRALAADLLAIRDAGLALPDRTVPPRVWLGVQARLASETPVARAGWRPSTTWLAAAAALLLAVGAAIGGISSHMLNGSTDSDAVATVAADLAAAEAHYQRAIAGLERIAASGDATLDPDVAAVLRANLQAIDGAIRDTRAALAERPGDEVARRGLFEALDGKVALLEQTVSLIDAGQVDDDVSPTGSIR